MRSHWAVSYTHLDVYKRQVFMELSVMMGILVGILVVCLIALGVIVTIYAVSYTHLDVYKRQRERCAAARV